MWTTIKIYLFIIIQVLATVGVFGWLIPEKLCKKVDKDGNEDDSNKWMWYVFGAVLLLPSILLIYYMIKLGSETVYKKVKDKLDTGANYARSGIKSGYQKASSAMTRLGNQVEQPP
tara:strand:- start:267 stop:614 length:348 start_codon:yes stop_codon:yes gene_type:complete